MATATTTSDCIRRRHVASDREGLYAPDAKPEPRNAQECGHCPLIIVLRLSAWEGGNAAAGSAQALRGSRAVSPPETEVLILDNNTRTDSRLTTVALFQNMPNPFSEQTFITFETPPGSEWLLQVERPNGAPVRTFAGNEGGIITLAWSGEDDAGRKVDSGTYICRLDSGGRTDRRKMTLMR